MADKENGMPIQDPENQENKTEDLYPTTGSEDSYTEGGLTEDVSASAEEVAEIEEAPAEDDESAETIGEGVEEYYADEADIESAETIGEGVEEYYADEPEIESTEPAETFEVVEEATEEIFEPVADESGDAVESTVGEVDNEAADVPDEDSDNGEASDDGRFELGVDENGNVYLKKPAGQEGAGSDRNGYGGLGEGEFEFSEDPVDPDDLVIHDEVVDEIKAEGERLDGSKLGVKAYIKHSNEAIKSFETALRTAQRALEVNRDDKEAPAILAGLIKISGKILEIKCNNLESIVRVKAHAYIKELRTSLHLEIDRYNELVITYASITGEQLTRLSTFLPESIASGKSLAVVPVLSYNESYVQVYPDEEMSREEEATTTVITPVINADGLIGDCEPPKSKLGCSFYGRRVRRASKTLGKECTRINKQIAETKALRRRCETELANLEKRTSLAQRAGNEYKNKVLEIRIKYGKQLSGINTVKAASAFARTRVRLMVGRVTVEREKLVIAYEYLRNVYRVGRYSQRKAAEKFFANAVSSYNNCAELCSKATGTVFDKLPDSIIEQACRGGEIVFPVVAYRRQLVETVGNESRLIGMALRDDLVPNEQGYAENSGKVLEKRGSVRNTSCLSEESAMSDRASAIASVMLDSLKESADLVITADEYEQFEIKSKRAIKYFKRALRSTERAMAKAFDENGVITALIENLRVIANLIEVMRINVAVAGRLNRSDLAKSYGRELYKKIDLYNGRAIDYTSIVGEQFSRISLATSQELVNSAGKLKIPVITYKDNYIEVFPKDPLQDSIYEKPRLWRAGVYTPLLMQHYRLTENRAVETTVINSPFVFDVMTDDMPAVSWWHPIGFWEHLFIWTQPIVAWWNRVCTNIEIWFVDESLLFSKSGLKGRQNRNDKKKSRYDRKLKRINDEHNAKILELETVVHESDRQGEDYQKKLYKINAKFSRKVYNLKVRFMKDCPGRNEARLLLERLVLERERLSGINQVLIKYRNYGRITFTRNILNKYKKRFVKAITAHNATARKLSEMVGVKFSEVSTSVADEIIRYGNRIKFPEIVCCREVIETVDGKARTVGDRWHGYGLYTGTSGSAAANGNAPIMSVGAMGYATDMGVPFLKADFDGMTMLGLTPGGVPLIGFNPTGETSIPFTGTPMMLSGADTSVVLDAGMYGQDSLILGAADVTDPYSGINQRGVDPRYTDDLEEDAKDIHSGRTVETPLDLEAKMIEERFRRALRARSMTSIDNVANWWKLVGSEINVRIMRWLTLRPQGFLRVLLPPKDKFVETVNTRVTAKDAELLKRIARIGGIIEIECKRFYSAVKTGVRRSQRVWSSWLHDDIERYNDIVKEYNRGKERHMHLEQLSLNIPDTIRHRKEDRPPVPPVLSLRNRVKVKEDSTPVSTNEIYDKLYRYARGGALKYRGFFGRLWAKLVTVPILDFKYKHGREGAVLSSVSKIMKKRAKRTYFRRQENENRHYYIRYEKSRSMRRYNKRTLNAIGVANDPIKYQNKAHKALRQYLARNFRIDYNMRIRQLIYRALKIDHVVYLTVAAAFAIVIAIAALFFASSPALQTLTFIGIVWAALPIVLLLLRIVYDIVMFIASCLLLITRNIWLIKHGARDVERHRYGAILDCFVTEQYGLLLACETLRRKPKSTSARKNLVATVNDYNKRAEVYSEMLRVPINTIEITSLIDKLVGDQVSHLTEIQNFVYVRELVERVDRHERGKSLKERELGNLVEEINQIINSINLAGSDNTIAVDYLQSAMQRLISFVQTDIKPTQNERFELKRDLIQGIFQFDIGAEKKEIFARDVIKVVDQIGGKDSRKIISVLAEDDMII
nr:hypothetical protein [Oscillospiraceae bacterium]